MEYADDTSLVYSAETYVGLEQNFKHDSTILFPWLKSNLLFLNKEKCKLVIYGYKTPYWANELRLKIGEGQEGRR